MADELHLKVGDVFTIENPQYVVNPTTRENRFYLQGREEGRREVLREIAACTDDPRIEVGDGYACFYCGEGDERPHAPACLWLRAQAVKEE